MNRIACTAIALALLACTGREKPRVDSSVTVTSPAAPMTVTARGIGPLQVGVNLREARVALPGLELPPGSDASSCEYARSTALPPGVLVMVENGIAVRVDVDSGSTPTAEGVRIGDAVSR